jgi:hypothetical protein
LSDTNLLFHTKMLSYFTNSGDNIRSADMFLTRGLEKLLAEKEIKKSNNAQLKKQIESLLGKTFMHNNILKD